MQRQQVRNDRVYLEIAEWGNAKDCHDRQWLYAAYRT